MACKVLSIPKILPYQDHYFVMIFVHECLKLKLQRWYTFHLYVCQ